MTKKDIDYDELDKAVNGALKQASSKKKTSAPKAPAPPPEKSPKPIKSRGFYMDIIDPKLNLRSASYSRVESPDSITVTTSTRETRTITDSQSSSSALKSDKTIIFGEVEEYTREEITTSSSNRRERLAEEDFVSEPIPFEMTDSDESRGPNNENYILGGRSPFLNNAVVEKRPLGEFASSDNPRAIYSTKNIYSQRPPSKRSIKTSRPPIVAPDPKKHSGWIDFLVILLVIIVGAGAGFVAWLLFAK